LPLPRQVTFDSNAGKLQEMVNSAVNHALINHSNVLSNTVHNTMVQLLKKDKCHHITLGQLITNQNWHRSILHRLPQPLWVQKLLLLQYRQAYLIFNLHQYDQIWYFQEDEFSLIQIYRRQLCQVLCLRIARFLLIGGDMVCLRSHLPSILGYLKCLMQQEKLLYHRLFHRWLKCLNMPHQLLCNQLQEISSVTPKF
jgi:hypothetical protein